MAEQQQHHKPSALLFDLDGTVADTDPLHLVIFAEIFKEWGIPIDRTFFNAHISGHHNSDIFGKWMPGKPSPAEIEAIGAAKEARFREYANGRLGPLPGLLQLMNEAKSAAVPMAAVTNAPRLNAEFLIDQCKLSSYLQSLVLGSECTRPKPFPDPYLEGMRRVGAVAPTTIVFEDSQTGVRAGSASGAFVVGVCTGHSAHALKEAGAHHCVADFTEVSMEVLSKLLQQRDQKK